MAIDEKLERLSATLRGLGSVLVCYSGGVDSAFVLAETDYLKRRRDQLG